MNFSKIESKIKVIDCYNTSDYSDAKCFIFNNKGQCILNFHSLPGCLYHKEYYLNRELHREDGPAIESFIDNNSKYYLNGTLLSEKEYIIKLRKYKIKKLNSL